MSAPILISLAAFDKSVDQQFAFTFSGSQVFKNRLTVYRNSDNALIHSQIQERMQLYYVLPANTLVNGIAYRAVVSVFDVNNVESAISAPILFYCYSSPSFSLNVTTNQIIQNSNFNAQITYSQAENELLKEFKINLYDSNISQIFTTDILYPTLVTSATISSLIDNEKYYIESTGITIEGTEISTGKIPFSVEYIQPSVFAKVELTNLPLQAVIKVRSNMISVEGKSNPSSPSYIDNEKVDLTANGSYVIFDSGFAINGDFTKEILVQKLAPYSVINEFTDGIYKIQVRYMINKFVGQTEDQCYFLLTAENKIMTYRICSIPMTVLSDTQQCYLLIQRKNNIFDIKTTLK